MNILKITTALARPKTLIASISPVLFATAWALHNNAFDFSAFCLLLTTAISLQILANIANDYFDGIKGTDSHNRVGPLRITASGLADLSQIKKILALSFVITLLLGLALSYYAGPLVACIFGISIICAILYSAGPFAFSYHGIAEPFAFSFFGPIPAFFATFVFSHKFHLTPLLLGCIPGLYSLILITINNLRDYESDLKSCKITLVVKHGRSFGKKIILLSFITQLILTFIIALWLPKVLFTLIIIPEAFYFFRKITLSKEPQDFALLLQPCAKLYGLNTVLWVSFLML